MICFTVAILAGSMVGGSPGQGETRVAQTGFGTPRILRFKDGAVAAASLQFDDAMTTQLANALPLLNARKIRATFFINPGRPQYQAHKHEWEVDVPHAGHELGNHTMNHTGAKSVEEAAKEIGDCSDVLRSIYGPQPRLTSFATPGGVPWEFTPAQLDPVLRKNLLIPALDRNFFDEQKTDPVSFVQHALDDHSWINVAMHGTGGEWLSTSLPTLAKLLDFMVAHRQALWIAPTIEVYKYISERDAALAPVIASRNAREFTVTVDCEASKLATFDLPVPALYDEPLTVEVTVPDTWRSFVVTQGAIQSRHAVRIEHKVHFARFDVLPNAGPANVTPDRKPIGP